VLLMSSNRTNGNGSNANDEPANRIPTLPAPLPPLPEPAEAVPMELSPVVADRAEFTTRALRVIGLVLLAITLGALVVFADHVLLLVFAGVLLGIFLRSFSELLTRFTPLHGGRSLAVVTFAFTGLLIGGTVLLAPRLVGQLTELAHTLPQAEVSARQFAERSELGQEVLKLVPATDNLMPDESRLKTWLTSAFSSLLTFIVETVFVIVIGIYLAHDPKLYTRGVIALVPPGHRTRAREVLGALQNTLHWWLLGRLLGMTIIGVLVAISLRLLGVPQSLALGVIAGLLEFIPTLGPFISVIPAGLVALTVSPETLLSVVALYLVLHLLEGYVIMPLIEQRTVSLPPAFTLTAMVLMGLLFGPLGLMLATPLVAVVTVLVYRFYIEDTLGDTTTVRPIDPCANSSP
jgi:predicted PurR-regulated permease PerM